MKHVLGGTALALVLAALVLVGGGVGSGHASASALPAPHPAFSDYAQVAKSETPPTQAQCAAAHRRCFTPQSLQAAYNVQPLHAAGWTGRGQTIAIVDSYGSDTMAHDLHVFDQAFGVTPMCGEEGVTCAPGMPKFSVLHVQGSPATKAPPATSNGTGLEDKAAWALEVALDVETAHAIAPEANILLVATPTAETLGVQGFEQMMNAEQYVVDNHLANVISQSFAAAEESFHGSQAIQQLRHAFIAAAQNGVSVVGASGDSGTANTYKEPVKNPRAIPFRSVEWPASDPLVTGIGGTYLCTDPNATAPTRAFFPGPPPECAPGIAERGWIGSGGGFSHVFAKPAYQDSLPAGSTPIGSMRGVPDVALQASSHTGDLVYLSLPPDGQSGLKCPTPTGGTENCSTGWYDIGGTSLATPQWAGLIAIADQMNGGGLGLLNPALYEIASGPRYAADFYDVTDGSNAGGDGFDGYPSSTGWDPVTGLGTPNAANLLPDLVAAANGG